MHIIYIHTYIICIGIDNILCILCIILMQSAAAFSFSDTKQNEEGQWAVRVCECASARARVVENGEDVMCGRLGGGRSRVKQS